MMKIEPFVLEDYEDSLEEHRAVVASTGAGGGFLYHGSPGDSSASGLGVLARGGTRGGGWPGFMDPGGIVLPASSRARVRDLSGFMDVHGGIERMGSLTGTALGGVGAGVSGRLWWSDPVDYGRLVYDVGDFEPPMDDASLESTLDLMWYSYKSYVERYAELGWDDIQDMIPEDSWEITSPPPGYFWREGWGPAHRAFLQAIHLIDGCFSFIQDSRTTEDCQLEIVRALRNSDYKFFIVEEADPHIYVVPGYNPFTGESDPRCPSGYGVAGDNISNIRSFGNRIYINASWLNAHARVADIFLFHAHRILWAYRSDILERRYFHQALFAGSMALSSINYIARNILHEMTHASCGGSDSADNNCSSYRVSFNFQCRVAARFGLWACDMQSGIDYEGEGIPLVGSGHADDGTRFNAMCAADHPGEIEGTDDWHKDGDWQCY